MLAREQFLRLRLTRREEGARFEPEAFVVNKCGIISPRSLYM
jgi:hypothetical protein